MLKSFNVLFIYIQFRPASRSPGEMPVNQNPVIATPCRDDWVWD